jgi:hypothetical protein
VPCSLRAFAAATLALALALAGCAKDLDLPPLKTAPVVISLAPARAWAGQLLRIEGARLDPDPTANVVSFAGASARGLRYDGATLVVRVPDDAGSGPIIVTNGEGTSAPFPDSTGTPFEYLGLGEPRRRAVATRRPILHQPAAVHGVGGEVFLQSSLYDGLLAAGNPAFVSPPTVRSAAAPWKGALYVTESAGRGARLWRIDAASGVPTASVDLPYEAINVHLLAMQVPGVIVTFSSQPLELAAWDLETLGTVVVPTALPAQITDFTAAADVGDGNAVVLGFDDAFDFRLFLVDVAGTPPLGPVPPPVLAAGALGLDELGTPRLAVAFSDRTAPGISVGEPLAAVSLASGDLAVARLGAPDPAFVGTVETFSTSTIEALAGAASLPVVLATRPADGLSLGADLVSRQILWSVPGSGPGPASASGDLAFVAHEGDNDVSVVNLASGSRVARVTFDVGPGAATGIAYGATAALLPADPLQPSLGDELFFPAAAFPGLVRFPLGSGSASVVSRTAGVGVVVASPQSPAVWSAAWTASTAGTAEAFLARDYSAPGTISVGGAAVLGAATGSLLALFCDGDPGVGIDAQLAVVTGATYSGGTGLGAATATHGIGFEEAGLIWLAFGRVDGEVVQLWDPSDLASAQAAVVLPGRDTRAALLLEDGLWLLGRSAPTDATLLGPDLAEVRTVTLADVIPAVHAVSPNGRLLVYRAPVQVEGETLLRFYRADPDAGFPQLDQIVVPGEVQGLAFDGTGERLWLITRSPDGVVLVD